MFDRQHNWKKNVRLNTDINREKIVNDEIEEKPEEREIRRERRSKFPRTFSASRRRSLVIVFTGDRNTSAAFSKT